MKVRLLTLTAMLAISILAGMAQGRFNPSKFKAEMHNYIIQEAKLTKSEADKFFPLFDEMKRKQHELHREKHQLMKTPPKSDAACKSVILKRDNLEIEMKKIEREYHQKFQTVLPATRVYDILEAERRFHRTALKKAANRPRPSKR